FLLFLNFTPKTFFNVEDLSITLGEALTTRAKIHINFEAPTVDTAVNYIRNLISFELSDSDGNELGPFVDEQVVRHVLERIGNLSVRKVNEVFSLILELAILSDTSNIDVGFVNSIREEIPSFEN